MLAFDEWFDLWKSDVEIEFDESGYSVTHYDDFIEERYMAFIDEQTCEIIDANDQYQLGFDIQRDEQGVLQLQADHEH